jgi:hypothetical protein
MAWVRIDDGAPEHRKLIGLDDSAMATWVRGLCYAARQLTDGQIPTAALPLLCRSRRPADTASSLVTAGLWEATEGGWMIHDYAAYQPSGAEVRARRSALSERRSEAGRRGAAARWDGKPDGKADGKSMRQACDADGKPMAPIPIPIPIPDHTPPTSLASIWPADGDQAREPSRGRPSRADLDRVDRIVADAKARPEVADDYERGVLRSVGALRLGGGYPSAGQLRTIIGVEEKLSAPAPPAPFVPRAPHHAPRPEMLADPSERAARKKGGSR